MSLIKKKRAFSQPTTWPGEPVETAALVGSLGASAAGSKCGAKWMFFPDENFPKSDSSKLFQHMDSTF
jgi:hypothetical protein